MQIQLEPHEKHTIQAYNNHEIKINGTCYQTDLILSHDTLITPWNIKADGLKPLLDLKPEVIILGSHAPDILRQSEAIKQFCNHQIGIECMTLDAACRTFNILLGEARHVVAGFIYSSSGK